MTPEQREGIIDSAKYLRQIRPIDPVELQAYVPGNPSPSSIAQVLRDDAYDLGLLERQDGTFVPVSYEPLTRHLDPIESFPHRYARRLETRLRERFGSHWYDGDSGELLRTSIRSFKDAYFRGDSVEYSLPTAYGYAIYHLPAYYAAIQYSLRDLLDQHLVPSRLRILDVGAGVGGPMLGLHDVLFGNTAKSGTTSSRSPLVEYHAVEPSMAGDLLRNFLTLTHPNFHATTTQTQAESFTPDVEYDLIVFANVLSEITDPVHVVKRYLKWLSPTGSMILLAPADRRTSMQLRVIERAVVNDLGVYSPTLKLWPDYHPTDECWSFVVFPDLEIPSFQAALDRAGGSTGEFVNVDVQFSYSILRTDGKKTAYIRAGSESVWSITG